MAMCYLYASEYEELRIDVRVYFKYLFIDRHVTKFC